MEAPFIYVVILLLNMFEFSLGHARNRGGKEKLYFVCSNDEVPRHNEIIKLFLSTDNLKIYCFFRSPSAEASRAVLSVFTSGGLAPSLVIMNSTYYGSFHFNLSLFNNRIVWVIDVPRENITVNTDIEAVEEWLIRITMHEGLSIYNSEGTLLDIVREPILQWNLGHKLTESFIKNLYQHVEDIQVTKSPCANDVALIGFRMNSTYNGVFIGLTYFGFWDYEETKWYELTDIIYAEIKDDYKGLTLIDMILTNRFLVLLTSLGLFVSHDLRYPSSSLLRLSRIEFCGFERVDYIKGKLWYNEQCFANRESFEVDFVTITFNRNRTLSESSSCFYSKEPFLQWFPCLTTDYGSSRYLPHVVTFLIDEERETGIYLLFNQRSRQTSVSLSVLKGDKPTAQSKFPSFKFPPSFFHPVGMVFHPRSNILYVYGNQVWISMDGGNSFDLLCDFQSNAVRESVHSYHDSDISFITHDGTIYSTKAGLMTYTKSGIINDTIFTLYYDHLGTVHKLTPNYFEPNSSHSEDIFETLPDLGFDTALAPQYISHNEILFFAYAPLNETNSTLHKRKFSKMHIGKVIEFSKGGIAYIKKVLVHPQYPLGFHTSVLAELIEPFGMEEHDQGSLWVSSQVSISYTGNDFFKITLQQTVPGAQFGDGDVGKTVLIPGYSSFLITSISDDTNALALATMPYGFTPTSLTFEVDSWYLYDFGTANGRKWQIHMRPCNYVIHQHGRHNIGVVNVVKYIDVGKEIVLELTFSPQTIGMKPLQVPPVNVIVGNPRLLEVKTEGHFDITDSYRLDVHIASRFVHKGSTSVALVLWDATIECALTTVLTIMKSSCSYLRKMHHIPGIRIPRGDWVRGVHRDSRGFNRIKTLPINYRPPSNMGISIPLTENFYHADPSKPIPRNLFHKSKETGKYKQCANATSRELCNCSEHQKFSQAVAFSDCKEKVHRFKFPVTQYPIRLEIFDEKEKFSVEPPYLVTMTEVNKRQNWQLRHHVPENVQKMKDYLEPVLKTPVYNPLGLNISIRIYVDEVPLPFPGHALIAVAASIALGGIIFTAFIFQLRNIHPVRALRRYLRASLTNSSNTSVNS